MILSKNKKLCRRYSTDYSIYKITPKYVAYPKSEYDLKKILDFAKKKKLGVTARGGGTGESGAALGRGIIVDFTKYMNKIKHVGLKTVVEPGVLLKKLKPELKKKKLMLPGVPLYEYAAIGGNLNTRSVGPRSLKYGSFDSQVTSVRGMLADKRVIDTAKKLPLDIVKKIKILDKEYRSNKKIKQALRKRPPLAGGYNLHAFDQKSVNDKLTHLIVGSVGTLLLATEIRLRTKKERPLSVELIYIDSFQQAQVCINALMKQKAAIIEYVDEFTLSFWPREYHKKGSMIIAGFEKKSYSLPKSLHTKKVRKNKLQIFWKIRSQAFLKLRKDAQKKGFDTPSLFDDVTFHPRNFSKILTEIDRYFTQKNIRYGAFGHIGIGSLHIRPYLKQNKKIYSKYSNDLFKILKKYNATLIGEHNGGPSKSHYIKKESKVLYDFMKKIKRVFDPDDLLNPHTLFDIKPFSLPIKHKFK